MESRRALAASTRPVSVVGMAVAARASLLGRPAARARAPRSAEEMDLAKAYAIRAQREKKSASKPSA